jgi:hypothetical protein
MLKHIYYQVYAIVSLDCTNATIFFRNTASTDSIEFLFDYSIDQLIIDENTADKCNSLINILTFTVKTKSIISDTIKASTWSKIADMLDVNYQSANNLLHRALLNLRKVEY